MKNLRNFFFLLMGTVLLLSACGSTKNPEKLVKSELELIKKLDEKTIQNFVSYEDIIQNKSKDTDVGEESTEAVNLFFKNFDYTILSTVSTEDTASVTVEIHNLDAKALAHDLCLALAKQTIVPQADVPSTMNSYFTILRDILKNNTYEEKTTLAHFELVHLAGGWSIQNSQSLEDELVGGLITYLSDPYLVTPQEIAETTFGTFSEFSAADWVSYLNMHDVFAIGSQFSNKVDLSLAEQISKHFSYSISQMKVDGTSASAYVDITSLDMASVLSSYRKNLLLYAETTESVRATDSELADKSASLLKEALDKNQSTIIRSIPLTFCNNGSSWEMSFGEELIDVILGGSSDALSVFNQTSH